MDDVYVDVDVEELVATDDFIDIADVEVSISYDDEVKRVVHNHMPYAMYRRPADYVSFRYSRYDRYETTIVVEKPVMVMYRKYQKLIDELAECKIPLAKKRQVCRKIMNEFQQKLCNENIRYRQLWRQIDTHGM